MNSFTRLSASDAKLQLCLERDRLLCDAEFSRSPTMCKLLRFLVDHKLSGSTLPLKAYTIAVDALGRKDSFDTQIDSYPRVQMGRLRKMLDAFYKREGGQNRLFIPYNHYEIMLIPNNRDERDEDKDDKPTLAASNIFTLRPSMRGDTPSAANPVQKPGERLARKTANWRMPALILTFLAGLFAALFYLNQSAAHHVVDYPSLAISSSGGAIGPDNGPLRTTTESFLITALRKFEPLRVFDGHNQANGNPDYLLKSVILPNSHNNVQLQLVDGRTREILWTDMINIMPGDDPAAIIAPSIVNIAGPYGIIARNELARARDDFSPGYHCLLQFDQYMRYRDKAVAGKLDKCLTASARKYNDDAYMLATYAFAQSIFHRLNNPDAPYNSGMEWANAAEQLNSESAMANFAVARAAFFEGNCSKGINWGQKAVALNPLDSRISGYLSLYMTGCGYPDAESYATMALQSDHNADPVIAASLAFRKVEKGDNAGARQMTEHYLANALQPEPSLQIVYILASARLGETDDARRVWRSLAQRFDLPETVTSEKLLSKIIANPMVARRVRNAFDNSPRF